MYVLNTLYSHYRLLGNVPWPSQLYEVTIRLAGLRHQRFIHCIQVSEIEICAYRIQFMGCVSAAALQFSNNNKSISFGPAVRKESLPHRISCNAVTFNSINILRFDHLQLVPNWNNAICD